MKTLPVAVQVYSVRDKAEKDFKATMEKIKAIGYDGVELAGLYGLEASYIKEVLAQLELVPVSAHVPYQEFIADLDATVAKYKEIGVSYIAIPYLGEEERPGAAEFEATIEKLKEIGTAIKENGMKMLYHNHDFEFIKMENGQYGLDYLYTAIGEDLLESELDTCWVKVAGEDPAEYVRKYSNRAPVVHLKDFIKEGNAGNMYELIGTSVKKVEAEGKFEFRPVGSGFQDFPSILQASLDAGSKWVVVEQDRTYDMDSMDAITSSREYLKSLGW